MENKYTKSGIYRVIINGEVEYESYHYSDALYEFETYLDDESYSLSDIELVSVIKTNRINDHIAKNKKILTDGEYSVVVI